MSSWRASPAPGWSVSRRSSLARLRALAPAERRLLLLALLLMPSYALGVRLRGLSGVRAWFPGITVPVDGTPAQSVRMVAAVARRVPWSGACLPGALTLQRILRAQGIESELRLGVRRVGGRIEAHAWIERDGVALLDTRAPDGAPFAPLVPARRP